MRGVNLRVDESTWKRIKIEAAVLGVDNGDVVRIMLEAYLKAGLSKLDKYRTTVVEQQ